MRIRSAFGRIAALLTLLTTLGVAGAGAAPVDSIERIEWRKVPVKLTVQVGTERRVEFPADVQVGVPAALSGLVRVQSVAGVVYLLAEEPFETQRLQVREVDSGAVYLLDLAAREKGFVHPVEILNPALHAPSSEPGGSAPGGASPPNPITHDYAALTRFAAQQLYAPERLLAGLPGVHRTPIARKPVALVRGGALEAIPAAAWRADSGLYVTAVKLVNRSRRYVLTDPRDLRGRWLTATFQHARLAPAGDEADTTCLYLLSARPFQDSL
jgi:integrating conjugative element protein (TIGR03749 family)